MNAAVRCTPALALALALSLACAMASMLPGCDDDPADALRRARAAAAAAAKQKSADGGALGSGLAGARADSVRALAESLSDGGAVDVPPAGGNLADEIDRFTTLDQCVASRHIDDAVLGDALLALGYDGFTKDACRVLYAAKQKRMGPCREITVSTLARYCEIVVAVVANDPEQCPKELLGHGRDPSCLALASRDKRLCDAALEADRPRCEAMLSGDAKRCSASTRAARGTCERDAERWRALLRDSPKSGVPFGVPTGKFRIEAKGAAPMRGKGEGDLGFELRRGIVLVEERGTTTVRRIDIGSVGDSLTLLPSLEPAIRLRVEWLLPGDGKASAAEAGRLRKLEIMVPGGGTFGSPPTKNDLVVVTKKLEPQRGGVVELTIDGTVGEGDRVYGLHVEARTFVRDLVVASPSPNPSAGTVKPR